VRKFSDVSDEFALAEGEGHNPGKIIEKAILDIGQN
jgi:uncharacterized protein YhfF